ncbi:DUF4181 domain-containing protein [Isachenkonia alkalipeptolytica]|uniref:DUF4181 domain-containing protein n=1 Tax=Isachenkonia alkalipeptolytica TaxID=2565777 RepID=A0AA43XLT2_9CLOT|nr:DUF4181 domain-containing protein [Isachenkonia alkalipeptolytica]NBG88654.1 DUF4181 domain-containing protein [Isachenkonia alkalipeptolytica]
MHTVEFVGSVIVLFEGIGFYLSQAAKIRKNNNIEGKIKLYRSLTITDKLLVMIVTLLLIAILYGIMIVNPQPYWFEFILVAGAIMQGLRAYFERKYEEKSNRHKLSILNSIFLLFLAIFRTLQTVIF